MSRVSPISRSFFTLPNFLRKPNFTSFGFLSRIRTKKAVSQVDHRQEPSLLQTPVETPLVKKIRPISTGTANLWRALSQQSANARIGQANAMPSNATKLVKADPVKAPGSNQDYLIASKINASQLNLPSHGGEECKVLNQPICAASPHFEQQLLLLKAIEANTGVFQFISPHQSKTLKPRENGALSVFSAIKELLPRMGDTLTLGNYDIQLAGEDIHQEIDGVTVHHLPLVVTNTVTNATQNLPLTVAGVPYTDNHLTQENIRKAHHCLLEHISLYGKSSRSDTNELRGILQHHPMIVSPSGIGRSAALISYHNIITKVKEGALSLEDEGDLDEALFELISTAREQRNPSFINSIKQLDALRCALSEDVTQLEKAKPSRISPSVEPLLTRLREGREYLLNQGRVWFDSKSEYIQNVIGEALDHLSETLNIIQQDNYEFSQELKTEIRNYLVFMECFLVFRCGCIDPDNTQSIKINGKQVTLSIGILSFLSDNILDVDNLDELLARLQHKEREGPNSQKNKMVSDQLSKVPLPVGLVGEVLNTHIVHPINLWARDLNKAEYATRKIFDRYPNPRGFEYPLMYSYFQTYYVTLRDDKRSHAWQEKGYFLPVGINYSLPYSDILNYLQSDSSQQTQKHMIDVYLEGKQDNFKIYFKDWYARMCTRYGKERMDCLMEDNPQCLLSLIENYNAVHSVSGKRQEQHKLLSASAITNDLALKDRSELTSKTPGRRIAYFISKYKSVIPRGFTRQMLGHPTPLIHQDSLSSSSLQSGSDNNEEGLAVTRFLRTVWDEVRMQTNAYAIHTPFLYSTSNRDDSCYEAFSLHGDVKAYKSNAVYVGSKEDLDYSYLHASECSLDETKTVILSQVPTNTTKSLFWYMIAQRRPRIILDLLTHKEKEQYRNGSQYHGDFHIPMTRKKVLVQQRMGRFVNVRQMSDQAQGTEPSVDGSLRLSHEKYRVEVLNSHDDTLTHTHEVERIHYGDWPDRGVISMTDLIEIVNLVRNHIRSDSESPQAVIHCKAGIGRSGVVMSTLRFANLLASLPADKKLSESEVLGMVLESLSKGRRERSPNFVQTFDQFRLILSTCLYMAENRSVLQ